MSFHSRNKGSKLEGADAVVEARGPEIKKEFNHLLRDAELAYPTIDDSQCFMIRSRGLIRRALLELGGLFVKNSRFTEQGEILFLAIEEIRG